MGERHDHCDHDPIECSYDVLVGEYREAIAERDRLREAVEAVRAYIPLIEAADADVDRQERLAAHLEVLRRLRQLDGSEEATDG
jgi:hypothetical protein